ncbi:MAG: hypothetical protein DCC46_08775 [Armatimonadetes bacterium]|nr:MAG: hypothetical protein DCC46_08775 [Armatimonadota bacterium]
MLRKVRALLVLTENTICSSQLCPTKSRRAKELADEPLQGSRIFDHIDVRADTGELWTGAVIGKLRGLPHSTALQHPEFE